MSRPPSAVPGAANSSAPRMRRCLHIIGSAAPWRWAVRPPRACCRRCWRAGRMFRGRPAHQRRLPLSERDPEREGLMERKGFPRATTCPALLRFLSDIKAGRRPARAPIYSHLIYDVMPNLGRIDPPDILIVEGLNVLQTGCRRRTARLSPTCPISSISRSSRCRRGRPDELVVDRFPPCAHGLPRSER